MGEFQQHQFRTIDQPLDSKQLKRIRGLSSRGHVTSTSATFVYHYSSFRGDEKKLMTKDFDAMLYISNWGTRRLMFRFPKALVDVEAIMSYAIVPQYAESSLDFFHNKEVIVMDLTFNDEDGGGWIEEDDYDIGDFTPLRESIINGDYRMLYMAWLNIAQDNEQYKEEDDDFYTDERDDEDTTPPYIPANLKKITSPLKSFMEFFQIDKDMIKAAAKQSESSSKQKIDYYKLLEKLPLDEKKAFLIRLLDGEIRLELKLKKHLEAMLPKQGKQKESPTFSFEALKASTKIEEVKRIEKEQKAAQIAYGKRMNEIAKEEKTLWKKFHSNIEMKSGRSYDDATTILKDLADMYSFKKKDAAFKKKMKTILKGITSKALLNRFDKVGLL